MAPVLHLAVGSRTHLAARGVFIELSVEQPLHQYPEASTRPLLARTGHFFHLLSSDPLRHCESTGY